jgi:uncharacterized phiE125 gp8 family phage protein
MINTYTGYKVTTESAKLPVPLEDARQQLRMDELAHDDAYVEGLIYAQCSYVENQYACALLSKTIEEYHSEFPVFISDPLWLRIAPFQSITSVKYVDSDGAEQEWSSSEYDTKIMKSGAFIIPKPAFSWPTDLADRPDAVKVTYEAGYGSTPASIPRFVTLGILSRVGRAYTQREDPLNNGTSYSDAILHPLYRFNV